MVKILNFIVLYMLLLSGVSAALSLGFVAKTKNIEINPGESGTFTVLFWNREEIKETIQLVVYDKPKDWIIFIDPDNFNLSQSVGAQIISLPDGAVVKTLPVTIIVKSLNTVRPGHYVLHIGVMAWSDGSGISFIQRGIIKLNVYIKGDVTEGVSDNFSTVSPNINQPIEPVIIDNITDEMDWYIGVLLIVIILILSVIVYRLS